MSYVRAAIVALMVVGACVVVTPPSTAADGRCASRVAPVVLPPKLSKAQPVFDWNGDFVEQDVVFPDQVSCATLAGTIYQPGPAVAVRRGRLPGAIVIPPSGGAATRAQVAYVARHLASNGYLALTVDPQGVGQSEPLGSPPCGTETGHSSPSPCPGVPFQRMDNWMDAAVSALDFYLSPQNPAAARVDRRHVGAVGHSLGARAASYLQDPTYDGGQHRIAAVVGLDNLSSNYYADDSAASGGGVNNALINGQPLGGDEPIAANVPGLGLASDDATAGADPDTKKFAFGQWRAAGVASGMLVFEGAVHGDFSQQAGSVEADLFRFATYTRLWFDRWLKGDRRATAGLLARDVNGVGVETFLSDTQHSAWFLPKDGEDCGDWRAGCP